MIAGDGGLYQHCRGLGVMWRVWMVVNDAGGYEQGGFCGRCG